MESYALIDEIFGGIFAERKAKEECERQKLLEDVRSGIHEIPFVLLEDEELPKHKVSHRHYVRLFPLGEYRRIWLERLTGRTTLYIGSDRCLYEYGPAYTREDESDSPLVDNLMTLRLVEIDNLETYGLGLVRDLLWRVWLV